MAAKLTCTTAGKYNDREIGVDEEFKESYIKGITSDDPREHQIAGGTLGGKVAQLRMHGHAQEAEDLREEMKERRMEVTGGEDPRIRERDDDDE